MPWLIRWTCFLIFRNLLLGLACNESIDNVTLDLSNNILGNGGCHVLESCIHGVRCVSTLDISDNGIDVEMAGVLLSISRNKSMKKLILNKNFQNMKSKHATTVIDAFVHLLQVSSIYLTVYAKSFKKLGLWTGRGLRYWVIKFGGLQVEEWTV